MFVVTIINPATTGSAACFELGRTGCQKPNSPIRSAFDELCSFGGRRRPHPNGVTASSVVDACSNVSIVVTVCRLDLARVGPTHRRVPQPGRARNRQRASQAGSCQTAIDGSHKSGMGVPRSIETRNKTHACMALRWNETKKNTVLRIRMGSDQGRGRYLVALA